MTSTSKTRAFLFLAAALALAAPTALGSARAAVRGKGAPQIQWVGSYEAALYMAKEGRKPLVIAILKDGNESTDQTVNVVYSDKRLIEALDDAVPVIASEDDHTAGSFEVNALGQPICPIYGRVTCAEHIQAFREVFARWFPNSAEYAAPQHIVAGADEVPFAIREYFHEARDLAEVVAEAARIPADQAKAEQALRKQMIQRVLDAGSKDPMKRNPALSDLVVALTRGYRDVALDALAKKGSTDVRMVVIDALKAVGEDADLALAWFLTDASAKVRLAAVAAFEESPYFLRETRYQIRQLVAKERDARVKKAMQAVL